MTDWEGIVRSHGRAVWRTAWRVLADASDADDCMQEAFVDAVELSRREPVRDWGRLLTRLATSRALDRLRRRIREANRRNGRTGGGGGVGGNHSGNGTSGATFHETHELDALPGRPDDPADALEGRELHERLRLSLAKLSPQQAETFYLRYMEELDYSEIAEALGIDVNQVGVVLHRARARLREIRAPLNAAR
jgi:RNA polymerase sigma-70 factor, ECF subfamily